MGPKKQQPDKKFYAPGNRQHSTIPFDALPPRQQNYPATQAPQVKWAPQMSGVSVWPFGLSPRWTISWAALRVFMPWHWTPPGVGWGRDRVVVYVYVCFMLLKCQQNTTYEFVPETRTKLWRTAAGWQPPNNSVVVVATKFIRIVVNEMPAGLVCVCVCVPFWRRPQYFNARFLLTYSM